MSTADLIHTLANIPYRREKMDSPKIVLAKFGFWFFLYAVIATLVQDFRPDLTEKLTQPFFWLELASLLFLLISSLAASVYLVFPDYYQQEKLVYLPFYALAMFLVVFCLQIFLSPSVSAEEMMAFSHAAECTLCVIGVAIIPTFMLSVLARRGATTHPAFLGFYAVLAATAIGCLILRLVEAQDSPLHLLLWHYIPMLALASAGALVGKIIFKW